MGVFGCDKIFVFTGSRPDHPVKSIWGGGILFQISVINCHSLHSYLYRYLHVNPLACYDKNLLGEEGITD